MLRFTLRQLEYFVAVGELGSISLAADSVNVSSPSISSAIQLLEDEFRLKLFVRHHAQGLSLTSAGRQMLIQAKKILSEAQALSSVANNISDQPRGPISVGCLLTFAQVVLPSLRRSFRELYPQVSVIQHELDQAEIYRLIRRGELDLALTYNLDLPTDLRFHSLYEFPPYALVDPDHPLASRDRTTINELAPYPMVLLDLPHSAEYFLSHFSQNGLKPNIRERTRDLAVMQSLVANGFGYSIANFVPSRLISPDGRPLKMIAIDGNLRPMRMGLLMANDANNSASVRSFADHCRKMILSENIFEDKIQNKLPKVS